MNSDWFKYAKYDYKSDKIIYKGIDMGISSEFIQDIKTNLGMNRFDSFIGYEFERIYKTKISEIRELKLNQIFS